MYPYLSLYLVYPYLVYPYLVYPYLVYPYLSLSVPRLSVPVYPYLVYPYLVYRTRLSVPCLIPRFIRTLFIKQIPEQLFSSFIRTLNYVTSFIRMFIKYLVYPYLCLFITSFIRKFDFQYPYLVYPFVYLFYLPRLSVP